MPAAAEAHEIARASLDLGVFESVIDGGLAERLAIGLVVLATDQTLEHEFRELIRIPGVAFYEARVLNDNDITPETLRAIGPRIAPALDLILPGVKLDVAGFGCTSATMTLGEEAVFAELRKARPGIACTTPVTAAFAAFLALGARRIGLLTPYSRRINQNLARYFEDHGVEVAAVATFERQDDREAARISLASIEAGAKRLAAAPGVECVFVSCTSLRVAAVVERVEAATGVPVTASNHAMAWHCLRLGGVADRVPGAGRLFELGLA